MASIQVSKTHTLTGHKDCVYTIQAGSSPNDLFSAGGDGMVVQWDLEKPETGELVAKLQNSIYALHFLISKNLLVAGQNFEGIHLIDYKGKKELGSLKLNNAYIFDIQSHDNKLFVAGGDGTVTVVDLAGLKILARISRSKQSARTIVVNSATGEICVGYSDNFIRVFDLVNFELKQEWMAHTNSIFTLALTAESQYLVSGSRDAHLKVWDISNGYEPLHDIAAHLYTINHIAFSPDNKHFVTCSMDKSIKVWDSKEFKLLKVIDKARHAGHGTSVNKLAWTSFNNWLISASDDRTLSSWNIIF